MSLVEWVCPKCTKSTTALAGAASVSHKCPYNKNQVTEFVRNPGVTPNE